MNRIIIAEFSLFLLLLCCSKETVQPDDQYIARIVGYDLNCSLCVVAFPDDSLTVRQTIGGSPQNYYLAVNLDKSDFTIGQELKVKFRKAEDTELRACLTLYPTLGYRNIYIIDYEGLSDLVPDDTVDLCYKDCLYDPEKQEYICFDTVLSDSRCPADVVCIWAGTAQARFKFEKQNGSRHYVDLYIHTTDTLVDGYSFSFVDLDPYPMVSNPTKPEDYRARIVVKSPLYY